MGDGMADQFKTRLPCELDQKVEAGLGKPLTTVAGFRTGQPSIAVLALRARVGRAPPRRSRLVGLGVVADAESANHLGNARRKCASPTSWMVSDRKALASGRSPIQTPVRSRDEAVT